MQAEHLSEIELTELADGSIEPTRLVDATEHVGRCAACARALAEAREAALAAGCLKQVAGPPDLRTRVARALVAGPAGRLSCEEVAPHLQEYVDGCLSPGAAVVLQHHLDSCPTCRVELKVFTSASRLVRALPLADSPARVRESIAAEQRRRSRGAPVLLGWRPALAAAAALMALGALSFLRHSPQAEVRPVVAHAPTASEARVAGPHTIASRTPDSAPAEGAPEAAAEDLSPADVDRMATVELDAAPRAVPVMVAADRSPKGPTPARVTPEVTPPGVALPAALGALRVAARSAARDAEVQRAMEIAGERFAVLNCEARSEATLARMSEPVLEPAGEENGTPRVFPLPSPGGVDGTGEAGREPAASSSAPAREGASVLPGPFV